MDELIPIPFRHANITDHYIRLMLPQKLQRFPGTGSGKDQRLTLRKRLLDESAGVLFIIDYEHFHARQKDAFFAMLGLGLGEGLILADRPPNRRKGECYDERGAFTLAVAFNSHGSSVQPYKLVDNGQPEPQAAVIAGKRRIRLAKPVENMRQELGVDSRPGISHRDLEMGLDTIDIYVDAAVSGGEFHRIRKQIPDDLLKPVDVAINNTRLRIDHFSKLDLLRFCRRRHLLHCRFGDAGAIQQLHIEPYLSGHDAAHV